MTRLGLLLLSLIAASALPLASQTLRFEVVSVKENVSGEFSGYASHPRNAHVGTRLRGAALGLGWR
jgi:hypothetical protein